MENRNKPLAAIPQHVIVYLATNGILQKFLRLATLQCAHNHCIRKDMWLSAFLWENTAEGYKYWKAHNNAINAL